ncbi:hypothetical protein B8X04_10395 [Brevibacterium casei]|uniref:Uncharacterized protein n=1 Tax=Brevibacterium casei TaxID=33889 RepID=A0A269ZBP7_9MICO|nr:hypothetical protein [Brevibacterium casei]PAK95223.1 hypothetical protein B8X04_10395 [Brevibacterium casei]
METRNGSAAPDAAEARLALQAADREMRSTQKLRIPMWLFGASGVINIGLGTLTLLNPHNHTVEIIAMSVLTALSLTVSVLLLRYLFFPPGYRKVTVRWKALGTASAIAILAVAVVIVLTVTTGEAGLYISAAWQFGAGLFCLLPVLLDVAEKRWPKRKGRHGA